MEDEEVLKDIQERAKKYIEDFISAEFMKLAGEEVQKLMEAAGILEEKTSLPLEDIITAMTTAINGGIKPKNLRRKFFSFATERDRKEEWEKLRAIERETACRFRQHKDRESAWAARKRTTPRQREWRGPWSGEKN